VINDPEELSLAEGLEIIPWAGDDRNTFVRLVPSVVTGRAIRRN
jgi:hypothetical protein